MSNKHKTTAYFGIFSEKLEKLKKQIKKARKQKTISKEHAKCLIKEAKTLRDLLKDVE